MEEIQEQNYHVCRICEQKFSSGRKLGGRMRRHSAIISDRKKQGIQEIKQEPINDDMGVDVYTVDRQITKKSQDFSNHDYNICGRKRGLDDGVNVHVMIKNAKRSWNGSSSSKDYSNACKHCGKEFSSLKDRDEHRRSDHTRKDAIENVVCQTCGKVFESMKALYGRMSCHSKKRSSKECVLSSDDEVIRGAVCLMMLSRGVRELDGVKLNASSQTKFAFQDSGYKRIVEDKVDGALEYSKLKNKSRHGQKFYFKLCYPRVISQILDHGS